MTYDDTELLKIVREERRASIGFGEGSGGDLEASRVRALAYSRGEMNDVPSLTNRSAAVDTSVMDAIETLMPDLMEVFFGGEDVVTFAPIGEEDEDKAAEETKFVQHVVFDENEGFLTIYSASLTAL